MLMVVFTRVSPAETLLSEAGLDSESVMMALFLRNRGNLVCTGRVLVAGSSGRFCHVM
jgi:hypothetical protein